MTQLARVFVALNLILAAGFLFSAATILSLNKDYKDKYEQEITAHDQTRENDQRALAAVTSEKEDLRRANVALQNENNNLKGTNDTQVQLIGTLTSDAKAKDTANNELRQTLDNLQATADRQGKHVERLEGENKKNADDARKAQGAAMDARAQLEDERKKGRELATAKSDLEKQVTAQGDEIKAKEMMLDYARGKGFSFENLVVMDPVRGTVVKADAETRLAVINVGKKGGVKPGYVLDVIRGRSYIARIEIETVYDNASAGTVKFLSPGATIQAGDSVTNTLN